MKTITLGMILSLGAAGLVGCASQSKAAGPAKPAAAVQTPAGTNVFGNDESRYSYAIGMMFGSRWKQQGIEVDDDFLVRGLKDAQSGGPTLLTEQEMGGTLNQLQRNLAAQQEKKRQELLVKNKAEGAAFLAENKAKPGGVTLPDGLQYTIITNGTGEMPTGDDLVTVNYRGTFIDGKEFDSSAKTGKPARLGLGQGIRGWSEALALMKVGSKWEIFV